MQSKHCLSLLDLSPADIRDVLDLARQMKAEPAAYANCLRGKSIALLFEKPSLRTRVSFDVGIYQLGGQAIYLDSKQVGPGSRETVQDIANNLGCWTHAIVARVYQHATLKALSQGRIPVVNALCDQHHPCQTLADLLTLQELYGDDLSETRVAYLGDGNNVCQSLMVGAAAMGLSLQVATPPSLQPTKEIQAQLDQLYPAHRVTTHNAVDALHTVDVLYTDTWISMGEEGGEVEAKKTALSGYQVNAGLLKQTGARHVMHCLPAHRDEEISSEVLNQQQAVVLRQAENRMHVQKALLTIMMNEEFQ
ncbi:ornithine carbamoyltransferase [Aliidiomarina sedimenti]|uniref:Ornithine carbamoyltransferase n=1 Tax=Aliidiomarina sedimenti TaxID=1933879 RepID=A0ABY0C1K2_9GAMM|nr:ornithine carbamoyltransferase [Aliidiomarina sedimenti]RUO31740.1 ornithine carbamoyltransferase [Aliidiomarina sedimenti]